MKPIVIAIVGYAVAIWVTLWALGFHIVHKPTADQLYGCTVAQADPATGECK